MKKRVFTLLVTCGALLLSAAPDDAQIYRATTRHVDFDGETLCYYNTTELFSLMDSLPKFLGKMLSALNEAPDKQKLVEDSVKLFVDGFNFKAVRAAAWSQKEINPDLYIYKSSTCLGKSAQMPGLFSLAGINGNLSLQGALAMLPADVIFAHQTQLQPGKFYAHLTDLARNSKNPQIAGAENLVNLMLNQQKINLPALLNSASGLYTFIIAGETPETFRFSLTIPDRHGILAATIKKFLPPAPQTPGRSKLPIPPAKGFEFIQPEFVYLEKEVILVSNFDRCLGKIHRSSELRADFLRLLPATGAGFTVLKFTPTALANLKKSYQNQPVIMELLNTLSPASAAEVIRITPDGVQSIGVADFSISAAYFKFSQKLSSVITSIQAAKNK